MRTTTSQPREIESTKASSPSAQRRARRDSTVVGWAKQIARTERPGGSPEVTLVTQRPFSQAMGLLPETVNNEDGS